MQGPRGQLFYLRLNPVWSLYILGQVLLWVELPVQRRLCLIFMRDFGSHNIHECFRGLTGSQRTPRIWGVTAWYQSLGIRMPRELGFGYPSPLGVVRCRIRYVIT